MKQQDAPDRITDRADYSEAFNQALTKGLVDFLKTSGIKKKDFAVLYECGATYVPRLLCGQKAVDIAKFMRIVLNAGWTPTLVFDPPKWVFEKTPKYEQEI